MRALKRIYGMEAEALGLKFNWCLIRGFMNGKFPRIQVVCKPRSQILANEIMRKRHARNNFFRACLSGVS